MNSRCEMKCQDEKRLARCVCALAVLLYLVSLLLPTWRLRHTFSANRYLYRVTTRYDPLPRESWGPIFRPIGNAVGNGRPERLLTVHYGWEAFVVILLQPFEYGKTVRQGMGRLVPAPPSTALKKTTIAILLLWPAIFLPWVAFAFLAAMWWRTVSILGTLALAIGLVVGLTQVGESHLLVGYWVWLASIGLVTGLGLIEVRKSKLTARSEAPPIEIARGSMR